MSVRRCSTAAATRSSGRLGATAGTAPPRCPGRPSARPNPAGGGTVPSLTANGKTVVCAALAGITVQHQGTPQQRTQVRLVWLAFSTSTPQVARTVYKVSAYSTGRGLSNISDARWADGSGSTMIIDWAVGSTGPKAQSITHFGLLRNGTVIPLPTPPDTNLDTLFSQADIAWLRRSR